MECDEKKLIKYGRNGLLQLLLVLLLLAILIELIICLLYFLPMEKSKEIECPQTKREVKQYEGGKPIIVWKRTKTGSQEVKVKGPLKKKSKGNVQKSSKQKNSNRMTTTELTISSYSTFLMNISTFITETPLQPQIPILTEFETEKSNFTDADAMCREKYPKGRLMVLYSPYEEDSLIIQLKKQPLSYFNECPYIFIGYRVNPLEKYTFSRKFQPLLPLELIGKSASTLNPGINLWDRNCATIKYTRAKDTFTVQSVKCAGNLYRCYICELIRTPYLEHKIGKEYCNNSTCLDIRDHRYRSLPASSFIRDCKLSNGRLAIIGNLTVPELLKERIRHLNNTHKFHCRDYPILVYNVHSSPKLETIRSEPLAYQTSKLEYGMSGDNCFSISYGANFSWVYTPCSQENCFLCRNDEVNPPPYPEPTLAVNASAEEVTTVKPTRGEMKQAIMTEEGMINQEWTTIKARTDGWLPEKQPQFTVPPEGQEKDGIDEFLNKDKTEEPKLESSLLSTISTLPPDLKVSQPNLNEIYPEFSLEKFLRKEYFRDSSGNKLSNFANKYKGSHSDGKENYINYPWNKDDVFAQQRDTDDEVEALVRGHY